MTVERRASERESGFTLVEVVVASVILSIVVVGTFAVYTHAVKVNRGNNLRAQALTVLQAEVEYYRGLRFVPVGSSTELNAGSYPAVRKRQSADGRQFVINVQIVNVPAGTSDDDCKFKEITVEAVPEIAETGWLANLGTSLTVQRVRAN
ncbi:MAG TPA: prepilin-type N-terminal cleavage/methylation domain-containing protein [Aridibacter sp.]|nr:prepilin-type N-terminal cleavage/methylation domain-containing protein [Aridibacter sp.]